MQNTKVAFLKRNQIDIEKWDQCLKSAFNQKVYAYSWYLDIMTNRSWSALVFGDYQAVFPVFSKEFLLLPYATQPYLCQQLGVFSIHDRDIKDFVTVIIRFLKTKFIKTDFLINPHFVQSADLIPKVNHILYLNKPYTNLYDDYNRNTKRNLKKSLECVIEIKETTDVKEFVSFLEIYDKSKIIKSINGQISALVSFVLDNNSGKILIAKDDSEILAACFYIESGDRIYFLLCGSSFKGTEHKSMYALIDFIIKKYAQSFKILDFTGSNIENIARRNIGFGAIDETYFHLKTFYRGFHRLNFSYLFI